MNENSELINPPLIFDDILMSNARLASRYYDSDLRFSGYNTPQVLFSGIHGKGALIRLESGSINPNKALMWFSPTVKLAATFGLEHINELPDTKDRGMKNRYVMAVFPHQNGDLGKWVYQETPGKNRSVLEFITNQDFPLSNAVFARLDQLLQIPAEQQPYITTRDLLLSSLGQTDAQQELLRVELMKFI